MFGIIPWNHQLSLASTSCSLSLSLPFFPMYVALYLSEPKFVFHFNTVTLVRSLCDCLPSATFVTALKSLVASANLVMLLFTSYSRFLMNVLRSMCPSTDPAGVLQVCNKLSLWKMTLYSYLIYSWTFDFFPVFISIVHSCQGVYFSSTGSHSFVLVFGSNCAHDGILLVTNAVICYITLLSFHFLSSSQFSCAELKIQGFVVSFLHRT